MKRGILALAALFACGVADRGGAAEAPPSTATADARCARMLGATGQPNAIVTSAVRVAAEPNLNLPAFCEITAVLGPAQGSVITSIYRLPDNWNGKMLGLGGGGWSGQLALLPPRANVLTATSGLPRGYATAQTDAGHASTNSADPGWVRGNPAAVTDFGHRAIHETAVLGKALVARYYGRASDRNYFMGCSTGGRMAMMESQRYPEDYDGIVAKAPVYNLLVQSSTVLRDRIFRAPGAEISPTLLRKVNDAALAACDKDDGLVDGVISKPYACNWDPAAMQCKAGADRGSCLTAPQVKAVRDLYTTIRSKDGAVGSYGMNRGSEAGWNPFIATLNSTARTSINGALGELTELMFGDAGFHLSEFDVENQAAVHASPFAKEYEASSTDLSRYFRRGGKLILWHGLDDPGPSALATADYYEKAVKQNGGENIRFYGAPAVYHCGGGPGADQSDLLTAMEQWVEDGRAPGQLLAANTREGYTRPLCEWPKTPRYTSGDPKQASSFRCE